MLGVHSQVVQSVHDPLKEDLALGYQKIALFFDALPVHVRLVHAGLFDHHVHHQVAVNDLIGCGDSHGFCNGDGGNGVSGGFMYLTYGVSQREVGQGAVVFTDIQSVIYGVPEGHGARGAFGVGGVAGHVEDDPGDGVAEEVTVGEGQLSSEKGLHQVAFHHGPARQVRQIVELVSVSVVQVGVDHAAVELSHEAEADHGVVCSHVFQIHVGIFVGEVVGDVSDGGHARVQRHLDVFKSVGAAQHVIAHMRLDGDYLADSLPFFRSVQDKSCSRDKAVAVFLGYAHDPVADEAHTGHIASTAGELFVYVFEIFCGLVPGVPADVGVLGDKALCHGFFLVFALGLYAVLLEEQSLPDGYVLCVAVYLASEELHVGQFLPFEPLIKMKLHTDTSIKYGIR